MSLCVARCAASDGEGGREEKTRTEGRWGAGLDTQKGLALLGVPWLRGVKAWKAGQRQWKWDAGCRHRDGSGEATVDCWVPGTGRQAWREPESDGKMQKRGRLVASEWQSVRNTGSESELPRRARAGRRRNRSPDMAARGKNHVAPHWFWQRGGHLAHATKYFVP